MIFFLLIFKTIMTTLCLNMIVKNESAIILRLLESVTPFIDSFCICDTGSTDNTIEIILKHFENTNIKGKIIQEPFQNFGYNRTLALNACADVLNSDYILLLDADMIFQYRYKNLSPHDFKSKLTQYHYYHILQGNSTFNYQNVRIVKNRCGFSYWGVTHEYVKCPMNTTIGSFNVDQLFILDIADGGCKDDKAERDIRLLTNGLIENPNNDRYTFYLANTYRDQCKYEDAIFYYKKRIEIGGWDQEVWFSHYSIGKCYFQMGKQSDAIFHLLEAYSTFPSRIENLYEIIKYYRKSCKYNLAYKFFLIADEIRKTTDTRNHLFSQIDVYDYKLDYELSIIGYYFNTLKFDLKLISMKILKYYSIHQPKFLSVISNYKFYADAITNFSTSINQLNLTLLNSIGNSLINDSTMVSSTPSISYGRDLNELVVLVRFVNYKIDEKGQYINSTNITTINVIAIIDTTSPVWILKAQSILNYDKKYDDYYIGIEDIRILRKTIGDKISFSYSSNRNINGNMLVEHGIIDINSSSCILSNHLAKVSSRTTEKNWVLFSDHNFEEKCVYEWFPLTIGSINTDGLFQTTFEQHNVPYFFKSIRGSTNGVVINDEIWFICHLVSYEDRRYYYHLVVVIDKQTYQLKTYTPLWTFEKCKVEYTLGLVYSNDQFIIGYSTMDDSTKYTSISKSVFDTMMILNDSINC